MGAINSCNDFGISLLNICRAVGLLALSQLTFQFPELRRSPAVNSQSYRDGVNEGNNDAQSYTIPSGEMYSSPPACK